MDTRTMVTVAALALAVAACDGEEPTGPGETPAAVASVLVEPDTVTLDLGGTVALRATAYARDGTALEGRAGSWSSSDTTVVVVDAAGRASARREGAATVTARIEERAARATVRVRASVAFLRIAPEAPIRLGVGTFAQLSASVHAANGTELLGRTVTWTSGRAGVASVDALGRVQALAAGVTTISATAEGVSAQVEVTVEATAPLPAVGSLEVRPRVVVTYSGVPAPLVATVRAPDGSPILGMPVSWSVSDPTAATVGSDGVVRGLREGEAVVTASAGGKTATVAVSFRTGWSYHLVYDREAPTFSWMDMRTGTAQGMLDHGPTIRSLDPSPSPTRSGFAYVYDRGPGSPPLIAVQGWSGTTYQFLTDGDQPAWSPDGRRVAFRGRQGGRADIWWIPADGSAAAVNLTADLPAGVESERPAWSPTGERIVFAASNARGGSDLWIMNADGTGKRTLTQGPFQDTEPTWLGDQIVFTRRTALGTSDLHWVFVNGALVTRLTTFGGAQMPAWAPDGRWIAFVVRDGESGIGDVYVVRPDGSDVRPVSLRGEGEHGGGLNPAWTLHW